MQTATIRSRGQITIPDNLRAVFEWLRTGSVVSILSEEDGVKIKPYELSLKVVNWRRVWEKISLARSFKGKRGNLSEFIISDRDKH